MGMTVVYYGHDGGCTRGTMVGIYPPYYARYPTLVGIHLPYYAPSTPPWVYQHTPVHHSVRAASPAHAEVSRDEALGSKKKKPLGEEGEKG